MRFLGLILVLVLSPYWVLSQEKLSLYISSDIGNSDLKIKNLLDNKANRVVLNGGVSQNRRVNASLLQVNLSKKEKKRLFINDGADEWRHGNTKGYQNVRRLDNQLDHNLGRDFIIGKGCAGPEVVHLDKENTLVFISSSWFLHSQYKPLFSSTDCDYLYEEDIWAELKDIIEKGAEQNVFLFAYHSKNQNTKISWIDFFAPFHGPSYNEHSLKYEKYSKHLADILEDNKNVYLISGNQTKTELLSKGNTVEVNACRNKESDWLKVVISENNDVNLYNIKGTSEHLLYQSTFDLDVKTQQARTYLPLEDSITVVAGKEYASSAFTKFWLGQNFRKEWTTPVRIPILNINTFEGGLTPYSVGGGMQTNSLKLKSGDGRKFAFRSVDKNTRMKKALPVMHTVVGAVKQDQISSQLPFGDVFMGQLLDYSDILHVTPKAYVMGEQQALGKYRDRFTGVLATVEEKPQGKNKTEKAFAGADKIFSSHEVYRKLLKSTKNRIDPLNFAKATLFSIWVGDWDRHQDNFKWAGYKDGDHWLFKPIPRDRDHVLALWEGVIGNISDLLVPNVGEFKEEIGNVKYFTFQGATLHNFLASRISLKEWDQAAEYLIELYDEEKIRKAWSNIPIEIQNLSRERIVRLLLKRKPQLKLAGLNVYKLFNENLDIYLSDEDNYIEIIDSSISIYDEKGGDKTDLLFKKNIDPFCQSINIYALDGKDIVDLSNLSQLPVKTRVIAGPGRDVVLWPDHKIASLEVYNHDQQDIDPKIKKTHRQVQANIYDFAYNSILPIPIVVNNSDFGTGFEIKVQRLKQKWNKRPWGVKQNISLRYFPSLHSVRFEFKSLYRNLYKNWLGDVELRAAYKDTHFDNYTGINARVPEDFKENQRIDQKYYVKNNNINLRLGLRKEIYGLSRFRTMISLHHLVIDDLINDGITTELKDQTNNFQISWFNHIDLNFLDNKNYPTSGNRYEINTSLGYTLTGEKGAFYNVDVSVLRAMSWIDLSNSILLLKAGWKNAGGETRFFNVPALGNRQNLRGTFNTIIRAEQVAYLNTELRKEVWVSENSFLPFVLGLSAFYDRGLSTLEIDDWQTSYGYGGGAYLSVLNKQYTVFMTLGESSVGTGTFLDMGLNFRFD